ncbi:MAG: hypothetical protein CVV44_10090 [Spirochaetae bacterium HGW-Spirochaetae-1]|jgi:hypothetical protein|nr:MAG: hypothetical protein CVV44_10090 [Spirochaetae bacterium HGW-Spirochaetae-1]
MKDQAAAIRQLLEKYRFTDEAAPHVREHVLAHAGQSFRLTLKKLGRYNPVIGAVVLVFLLSKRLGIGISMLQSAAVTVVTAAVVAGSVATGGYYGVKAVIMEKKSQEQKIEDVQDISEPETLPRDGTGGEKERSSLPVPVISVEPFTLVNLDETGGGRVLNALKRELETVCAKRCTVGASGKPDMILRGQLAGNDGSCILFLRLVRKDGQILFARSFEGGSPADLEMKAGEIAGEIYAKVK